MPRSEKTEPAPSGLFYDHSLVLTLGPEGREGGLLKAIKLTGTRMDTGFWAATWPGAPWCWPRAQSANVGRENPCTGFI